MGDLGLLGLIVFGYWLIKGGDLLTGILFRTQVLHKPIENIDLEKIKRPAISLIFAAKNEERHVSQAVLSMLGQKYPDFEVIAVNDRSDDKTGEILSGIQDPKLRVLTVEKLPPGWLGKTHALYQGYLISRGEWLLFTDADVWMDEDTLRAALEAMESRKLDHLALFPGLILKHYIEVMFTSFFTIAFNFRYRPWAANSKRSLAYVGIGAFNMVRRSVYEKVGTHQALALDVADDMILGRLIKRAGFRQMGMLGQELVRVRWVEGFKGVLESLKKNAFRGLNYNYLFLIGVTVVLPIFDILPFLMLFLAWGQTAFYFFLGAALILFLIYLSGQRYNSKSLSAFWVHPITCFLFLWILWDSAMTALIKGGVVWRGTFYPLKELRKGMR